MVVGVAAVSLIAAAWAGAHQADLNSALNSAPAAQSDSSRVLEPSQLQSRVAGKPVAYLFIAFGCTSCVGEIQAMQTAARDHGAVQLVGVDMVGFDSPADLTGWLQASGVDSTTFVWTIDKDGTLVRRFGVANLGTSVLIDSSGRVRFVNPISIDPTVLSKQLAQLT